MRTLGVSQDITVDGSIEMLGDWFNPEGQAGVDRAAEMNFLIKALRKVG